MQCKRDITVHRRRGIVRQQSRLKFTCSDGGEEMGEELVEGRGNDGTRSEQVFGIGFQITRLGSVKHHAK